MIKQEEEAKVNFIEIFILSQQMDSIHFLLSHNDIELNCFAPQKRRKRSQHRKHRMEILSLHFSFNIHDIYLSKNKMFNFIRVI